MIPRRVQS